MYADITIKAKCHDTARAAGILLDAGAEFIGLDVQTDTYYETDYGKLKHRQGNIENVLIHYNRNRTEDARQTEVLLYLKNPSAETIAQVCEGKKVLSTVRKSRQIFLIQNVKFHIDFLEKLGHFIEIEAIDLEGSIGLEVLKQQCDYYTERLQIEDEDLESSSYVDLLKNASY